MGLLGLLGLWSYCVMKIQRFEDITAWQETRILVKRIYSIMESRTKFRYDNRFKSQITSAAVSIMSNIAEGFSRKSNKEFIQFLFIAKGSLAEVQSQLYVALDLQYIIEKEFREIYDQADKITRQLSRFITYLLSANK